MQIINPGCLTQSAPLGEAGVISSMVRSSSGIALPTPSKPLPAIAASVRSIGSDEAILIQARCW